MSAEQTLESLVELLEKFNYKKDEDSDSYSFFEAKLNEDWVFHLVEEAKRGVVEIAKLREELAFSTKQGADRLIGLCKCGTEREVWQKRAEAAEAKLKAESEQEPTYFVMLDTSPLAGWHVVAEEVFRQYPEDRRLVRYAAPVPPVDAQELQKKYDRLDAIASTSADLNNRQAERIAKLERKLAEQQVVIQEQIACIAPIAPNLADTMRKLADKCGSGKLNALLAQARYDFERPNAKNQGLPKAVPLD